MLPKMSALRRDFGETKYRYFLIKDNELLEKYNDIWDKVSRVLKKGFDSESVYNEKLKTKIKSYAGKVNTIFHNDKMPREVSHCLRLSMVLIGFASQIGKNVYPHVFLEECKYIVKEKEVTKYINEDLKISSHSDASDVE